MKLKLAFIGLALCFTGCLDLEVVNVTQNRTFNEALYSKRYKVMYKLDCSGEYSYRYKTSDGTEVTGSTYNIVWFGFTPYQSQPLFARASATGSPGKAAYITAELYINGELKERQHQIGTGAYRAAVSGYWKQ